MQNIYQEAVSASDFAENLRAVQKRINEACARANRDPKTVRLLPVSKTVNESRLRQAYAAGMRFLGENKVQEASQKEAAMRDLPDLKWAIIGHLQTNKAKLVARFASEFQALDNLRVAETLDCALQKEGRALEVLVQINTSNEASKYGLLPEEALSFIKQLLPYKSLKIKGLMTLALFSDDHQRVRDCFLKLRKLQEKLRQEAFSEFDFSELSMGMSGDFEIAIEEGATIVRVGQAIFGARTLNDTHFWPTNVVKTL